MKQHWNVMKKGIVGMVINETLEKGVRQNRVSKSSLQRVCSVATWSSYITLYTIVSSSADTPGRIGESGKLKK